MHDIISETLQLLFAQGAPSCQGVLGRGPAGFPWDVLTFSGPVPQGWCCLAVMCLSKMCSSSAGGMAGRAGGREAHNWYDICEAEMFALFLS